MFSEGRINKEQRGLLKELVLVNDESLLQFLDKYESSGNIDDLYLSIMKLVDEMS